VDSTGRERTQAALEEEDSGYDNFQGSEAYSWRFKAKGTSSRNNNRAQTTDQKAFSPALIGPQVRSHRARPNHRSRETMTALSQKRTSDALANMSAFSRLANLDR